MNLDRRSRTRLLVDVDADHDLTGTQVDISIDGQWYPATWTTDATQTGTVDEPRWTRHALTDATFVGPDATGPGTQVTLGTHPAAARIDGVVHTTPALVVR